MAVLLAAMPTSLRAQTKVGPDFSLGVTQVGQVRRVALPNGHIAWPSGPGYPYQRQLYKGNFGFFQYVDFVLGIPEGPWTPRVFDQEAGDTVSLGPAVAEGISRYVHEGIQGPDWGPCLGSRGMYFSGELLAGDLYPDSPEPEVPIMATSTLPETWPYDVYGFRRWPGAWAKDPETGKPLSGVFVSDQDLFFCFTDKPYANRTSLGAQSYPIGAKVEC
ncbi:MAG: hypothetical protein H5U03_08930, partial [Clostridia bacterium]|nr:hypothetical protein [Clostridia bacterium]